MHIQLSSSLHFYLLCLVLNSSDRNNAFWRHSMLVKQFSSLSRKHRISSLQICVYQTVEPKHRIWRLMQERVYIVQDTCPPHQRLKAAPHWHITKRHRRSSWSKKKAVTCMHEGERRHFEHLVNWNQLFSEPTHYTTGSFLSHQPRKTRRFASFPSQLFKS